MYFNRSLKLFAVLLLLVISIISCKKQKPKNDPPPPPPKETPSIFESLLAVPTVSYCGSALTSTLKIQDGTDIGTVTVGNDGFYLYLIYNLTGNWYIGDAHSYAGRESVIPRNIDGNPVYTQFPGKQDLNFCDMRQSFAFRILLSSLSSDNGAQCSTNEQYYIAMRASVRQIINSGDCVAGTAQPAWGAPFLINPGSSSEWATAFYYCKQDCSIPTISWCAYSQGYWFKNPNSLWCQNVSFGSLTITELQGDTLWPPQNNWIRRSLFQGSAIQLSLNCVNSGNPIPTSIANDYNRVASFLSTLTYANIVNGTFPVTTDTTGVRAATGNIGKWICNNHCTTSPDPTACTGF